MNDRIYRTAFIEAYNWIKLYWNRKGNPFDLIAEYRAIKNDEGQFIADTLLALVTAREVPELDVIILFCLLHKIENESRYGQKEQGH